VFVVETFAWQSIAWIVFSGYYQAIQVGSQASARNLPAVPLGKCLVAFKLVVWRTIVPFATFLFGLSANAATVERWQD
jgi:hypothetical protein